MLGVMVIPFIIVPLLLFILLLFMLLVAVGVAFMPLSVLLFMEFWLLMLWFAVFDGVFGVIESPHVKSTAGVTVKGSGIQGQALSCFS